MKNRCLGRMAARREPSRLSLIPYAIIKTRISLLHFNEIFMVTSIVQSTATPTRKNSASIDDLKFHPLANLFPLLGEDELTTLSHDIADNGLQFPIALHEGMILDGRNRYTACVMANVTPEFVEFEGDDPVRFVVTTNLHRRHLNESQRAMVAADLANMRQGERTDLELSASMQKVSQPEAASLLNISTRIVASASKVKTEAIPEVIDAVKSGKISISAALDLAEAAPDKQREVIAKDDKKAILAASKEIRKEMAVERREKRTQQIVEAVKNNKPLDRSLGTFAVIYADPAWAYDINASDMRDIENHYPTMTLEEICSLDVKGIAHDDAVLFLWATSPKLKEAFQVLDAWGFDYRTCAVWDKEKIGMGYYFRQQHELLLVATRGKIPAPAAEDRPSSVIRSPRGEHSRKPESMYEMIDAMYPHLPKIELFARNARSGWSRWGNQS